MSLGMRLDPVENAADYRGTCMFMLVRQQRFQCTVAGTATACCGYKRQQGQGNKGMKGRPQVPVARAPCNLLMVGTECLLQQA